jgi:hypothetical protein
MKNIPIFINFNRQDNGARDARASAWWIANLNFVNEKLFSYPSRNLDFVRRLG